MSAPRFEALVHLGILVCCASLGWLIAAGWFG